MAHFAAGARFSFSIKVKMGSSVAHQVEPGVNITSNEVSHPNLGDHQIGSSKRQPANRANVVLELGRQRTFNRPVAAIMDARRHFIEDRAISFGEKFEGQNAHIIKGIRNTPGELFRFFDMRP